MTRKVAQDPCGVRGVPLLRPQGGWAKLSRAALSALLVMIWASVQAADLTVINCSDYTIRASLDYWSDLCRNDENVIIRPRQNFNVNRTLIGPLIECNLKEVIIWIDDASGAPMPIKGASRVWRERKSTNDDRAWRVSLDANNGIKVAEFAVPGNASVKSRKDFNEFKNRNPDQP